MITYEDALQACLDAVRAGRDQHTAVAAYPEHAERLREELQLATSIRSLSPQLPPISGRASIQLQAQLAEARRARPTAAEPGVLRRIGRWPALLRGAGLATAAALAAVAVLIAMGAGPG